VIVHKAEVRLPVAPRHAWEIASSTDALDAAAGLPAIQYRDEPQPSGMSRRFFEYRLKGLRVEGEELPFSWRFPQGYRVERTYTRGPFLRTVHTCSLRPDGDDATFVVMRFDFEPRNLLGRIFAFGFHKEVMPLMDQWMIDRAAEVSEAVAEGASGDRPAREIVPQIFRPGDDFGSPATSQQVATIDRLIEQARRLEDGPGLDPVATLLKTGSEYDVARLRPLELARAWDLPPLAALNACLAATKAGVLRLRWDVICPHCRGDKDNLSQLKDVKPAAYCSACNLDFDLDLERSLEAVFVPHSQVRAAPGPKYCLGGPGTTPHVYYQGVLAPGEEIAMPICLSPGTYRLRVSGIGPFRWLHVRDDTSELVSASGKFSPLASQRMGPVARAVVIRDDDLDGPDSVIPPWTEQQFEIQNSTSEPRLVCIESVDWATDALQAGELVANQQFRDLFSSEMLAEGVSLAVENVTIMFTDLVGSTAMYGVLGDARAFNLVWIHFDLLVAVVKARGGAIVKTIGDAIMASFVRASDAILAAADVQERIADHMRAAGHDYPVGLKVGLHQGPCIVVTLNERLDYFGTTVNLAARTEGQSRGDDIVMTASTLENADGSDETLRGLGYRAEPFDGEAKGFSESVPMVRWVR
jgi:class 3 adenylate cyclase